MAEHHVLQQQEAQQVQPVQDAPPDALPQLPQPQVRDRYVFHSMTSKSLMMNTWLSKDRSTAGSTTA